MTVVVKNDETLHADALGQQGTHQQRAAVRAFGQRGGVVLRDQAAHRHTGRSVEQWQHGVEHLAADVFKIHVDALGAGRCQQGRQIGAVVVNAGVKAQFLHGRAALVDTPGNTHHAAALELGDLSDHGADRAGGRGHHHRFTGLGRANVQQPHVGGEAGHAQHTQGVGGARQA